MNPGKIKPQKPKEDFTERLNKRIGRVLGKKPNTPIPDLDEKVNNLFFIVMVIVSFLLLWSVSGFYFLPENQYALITRDGKFQKTIVGPDAGFTLPYPFADIIIIDGNISEPLYIGKTSDNDNGFLSMSKDMVAFGINADFSYQVFDPSVLWSNHLQDDNDIDRLTIWLVQQQLHNYIVQHNAKDILNINIIVLSNQLRDDINQNLSGYGIKLKTLNLSNLKQNSSLIQDAESSVVSSIVMDNSESNNIAVQLINEANEYQKEHIVLANANVVKFKQLLPQYKAKPVAIVEQMYYQLLADVPVNHANQYPLLNLTLTELLNLANVGGTKNVSQEQDTNSENSRSIRNVDRSVVRERNFNRVSE